MSVIRVVFSYRDIEVKALVHIGDTSAAGDNPDTVLELDTDLPDGPSGRLERILEEQAIEEAYKAVG